MIDFGKNIKILNYNESLIDKYKNKDNLLRHARYIPGKTEGIFLIDKRNDSLVGYAAWEGDTLIALEIIKDYQSLGLGKKLLAFCEENGVRKLTVSRKNIPAISLYRKSGWKNSKKQENNKIFYMEKAYSILLSEDELRLFSEFLEEQREFGARERKMRRKLDRAAQNAEMHANRAVNKAEKATAAIKSGNTALAETHTAAANKAISSVQHDIKRLTDQTKVIGTDKAKEAAAKVSENVASTAKKAEGIINKNASHLKIKRIGKAALATGAVLGTGALVASAISKKNKDKA